MPSKSLTGPFTASSGLTIERCSLHRLRTHSDDRGKLVAIEGGIGLFDIRRVYYLFASQIGASRGFHSHRNLQQLAICLAGACTFRLDDGIRTATVRLSDPSDALAIGPLVWREMHDFTPDCVVLVLASEHYDESDYIRDLDEFHNLVAAQKI